MVLMLENRAVPNTELVNEHRVRLSPADRDRLNVDGLLQTTKDSRPYLHRITDKGIDWCVRDLVDGEAPSRSGPVARVHALLLRRFVRYHQQRGTLNEAICAIEESLDELIRKAYHDLSVGRQDWIRLARIRSQLNGAAKDDVDEALLTMTKTGTVHLVPDSNRKVLTDADHAAAIRIGGEDKHLMAIEES
jgi:hypothetical protein